MIIHCDASLEDISKEGRTFNWKRPACKRCKSKVWGHGFVIRFFNSIKNGLLIRRWRCPCCGTIYICRPREYWSRFQESIPNVFKALIYRVTHRKWPTWTSRQRGGHWLNKLLKHARINLLLKECVLATVHFYQNKNLAIN